MDFVDTHCHLQFVDFPLDPEQTLKDAFAAGVTKIIAVGCTLEDSRMAVEFAANHANLWAAIGLHPHEGTRYVNDHKALHEFRALALRPKVVAIGETGLDYHYQHSNKADQAKLLRFQLDLALEHKLPLIFHVREAFEDFWHIFDQYNSSDQPLTGVIHSFSSDSADLNNIISRGLFIGLNGIMTFTKDTKQLDAAKAVPIDKLLLETDAPFLTPAPFRGKICESKYVRTTGEFLSNLRGEPLELLASATTLNAEKLFRLS